MSGVRGGAFLGDKAFDANKLRDFLAARKIEAILPARRGTRKRRRVRLEERQAASLD